MARASADAMPSCSHSAAGADHGNGVVPRQDALDQGVSVARARFSSAPGAGRRYFEPRACGRRYGGGRHRVTLKLRRTGRTPMPDDFSGPNRFARDLFDPLPARYDRLAEILSFGQNGRWRSAMVDRVLSTAASESGVILDVASGKARVELQHERSAEVKVVGVDMTEAMLRRGRRRVAAAGKSSRIGLVAGRAEQLPF